MSVNPRTLRDLGAYWASQGGVRLGVIGSMRSHGRGYHLGRDRIFGPCAFRPAGVCVPGLGDADYSVRTARDRAGLSNAASAIDLGRLDGSLTGLRAFSRWLVTRCRANGPGTSDIREVIYSPDGTRVLRWDRERGHTSAPRSGEADNSHLTHTHISFYRDSERRDKRPIFAPYFDRKPAAAPVVAPPPAVVAPPAPRPATPPITTVTVKAGDTLSGIAARNRTTLARIRALNPGIKDLIRPGQVIRVK